MSGPTRLSHSIVQPNCQNEVSAYGSYLLGILNGYGFTHRHGAYTKPAVRKEVEVSNLLIPGGFGPPPLNQQAKEGAI